MRPTPMGGPIFRNAILHPQSLRLYVDVGSARRSSDRPPPTARMKSCPSTSLYNILAPVSPAHDPFHLSFRATRTTRAQKLIAMAPAAPFTSIADAITPGKASKYLASPNGLSTI